MIRPPPRSTPFPTRRSSDLPFLSQIGAIVGLPATDLRLGSRSYVRSEEHTSELQSHVNLVCRLLLEKKKGLLAPAVLLSPACSQLRNLPWRLGIHSLIRGEI